MVGMNKITTCLFVVFSLSLSHAARVDVALPDWEFVDTEVSTNIVRKFDIQGSGPFEYQIAFEGTSSNNVEIAFGRDVDDNQILSPRETGFTLGWDRGAWFFCVGDEEPHYEEETANTPLQKTLVCSLFVRDGKLPKDPLISTAQKELFTNLTSNLSHLLHNPNWNLVRLTARGHYSPQSHFHLDLHREGLRVILR